jgi:hypothetical protein
MMLLIFLICNFGIARAPMARIGLRRARIFSRISRTIYKWHKISRILVHIGIESRTWMVLGDKFHSWANFPRVFPQKYSLL